MGMNIEIKAAARDVRRQRELASQMCNSEPKLLEQMDTFFNVARGRLKLREFTSGDAELIQYERPNRSDPTKSCYSIVPTSCPGDLKKALKTALGILGIMRKRRYLYIVGQTRIHFDEVANLGEFIELEVVLSSEQREADAIAIAHTLMKQLEISKDDLIEQAYIDMLCMQDRES